MSELLLPDRRVLHTPELTFPRTSICVVAIRSEWWQALQGKMEYERSERVQSASRHLGHLGQLLLDGKAGRAICLIPMDTRTSGRLGTARSLLESGSHTMPSLQLSSARDAVVLSNYTSEGEDDQHFLIGRTIDFVYVHHSFGNRQQLRMPYGDCVDDGRLLATIFNASAMGLTKEGLHPYPASNVRHACMNYHNVSGGDHMDDAKAFASLINT